jgi:hypothetical protein
MHLRFWSIAGVATMAISLACAQSLPQAPETGPDEGAHSPPIVDQEIEAAGKAARERGDAPSARFRKLIVAWPDDRDTYTRMAHYTVLLLTMISQDSRELPVKRVYLRAGSAELPVRKIWSVRSVVPVGTFAAKMFGRHREDAFYLVPGSRLMADGALLADLTARRHGMTLMQLPSDQGRKYLEVYPSADPARRAKPDAETFKAFMAAKFPGYPVPRL